MNKTYRAVIIGGGAAGLACAVQLLSGNGALCGKDVLVIERNDRVAKKLLATGNGQCNLCNENISAGNYYGDANFIASFLKTYSAEDFARFFACLGIYFYTDGEGRQYPISRQAGAVSDAIRAFLTANGCNIVTGARVVSLGYNNGLFTAKTADGQSFYGENAVIAVGGAAAKQFGTDGSSYGLAQSFGHKITQLKPSLVQIKTQLQFIRGLKGIKERARVTAMDGNVRLLSKEGDVLFTEFGVSGSAIFAISPLIAGAKDPAVSIEFMPEIDKQTASRLIAEREKLPFIESSEILTGLVNKRLGQAILKRAEGGNPVTTLKDFRLKVTGTLGFDNAQVTRGGICTDKIDAVTFESRLQSGLFIVGEVLDIDGDCGGYNLAFAFSGGRAAANAVKQKYSR